MDNTTTNYFALYNIPLSFHPDAAAVKNSYYDLSRRFHPDRYARATDTERSEALRIAALNNEAYKTFTSSNATMAYLLKLHDVLEDEEKYTLPPAFLMEMMDLNEAISDYEMDAENETARQQATTALQDQLQTWADEADPLTTQFDAGDHSKELLLKIKDYYMRKKYLLRIQERINRFATR